MSAVKPPTPHLIALDSWRGICAVLVAVHHFFLFSINQFSFHIIESFFLFVDFFFVLSGFVISLNYAERLRTRSDLKDFIIRRFARVWPLHALVMASFLCFYVAIRVGGTESPYTVGASGSTYMPLKFPLVLAMLNSTGLFSGGWNLPSWSISAEFLVYLVFGFCMLAKYRSALICITTLIGALFVLNLGESNINMTANFGVFRCMYGFGVGVGVHHLYTFLQQKKAIAAVSNTLTETVVLTALPVFLYMSVTPSGDATRTSVFAPIFFALVVLAYSGKKGRLSTFLSLAPFRRVGQWSYSIYINHWLVLTIMAALANAIHPAYRKVELWGGIYWKWDLSSTPYFFCALGIYLAILIPLSSFTYRTVEDPLRQAASRLLKQSSLSKSQSTASTAP